MKICSGCGDDAGEEPKDHNPPCRIRECRANDHSTCEHDPNMHLMANMGC